MSEFAHGEIEHKNQGFAQRRVQKMLSMTGIEINGQNPWDIQVVNPAFFRRVLVNGSLGLGESYVEGWWHCKQLDQMINLLLRSPLSQNHKFLAHIVSWFRSEYFNLQKQSRAFRVGELHYDIGNELYQAMLDKRMVYTCGYWSEADNLDDAQRDKLDLVCRKLDLRKGMKILDIGCGWGSFAKHAAQKYGVEVTGITVSKEQVDLGMKQCAGLPVELRLQDYRDLSEQFDAIVSLGMFEHVGHKNYRVYMDIVKRSLKPGAKFLLHTIGKNDSRHGVDPWISKYIFPNGEIPSLNQIASALESLMVVEDIHNFGPDYDKTLMAWFRNFHTSWPTINDRYPRKFYRLWEYYLKVCAGAFRARNLQLWQIVISLGDTPEAYRRPV